MTDAEKLAKVLSEQDRIEYQCQDFSITHLDDKAVLLNGRFSEDVLKIIIKRMMRGDLSAIGL